MLSPDYLLHISEGSEEIAEQLHSDIVKRIVKRIMIRIGRGDNYLLTAQDKWAIENLQQAGYLLEDIQKEIAKATKRQQSEIAEAMEDAGVKALDYDDKIYRDVGLSPTQLTKSPELIRLMQRNYEATMGEWANFTKTTADETQRFFLAELDKAYNLVSTGAMSYTKAVKEVISNIVSNGVTVTYPSGRTDTIETATLRAVRTGISQATAQIQVARMDEMDVDLVITSSHLGARPSHQEWQGRVFSRSGKSKYPPFVESTGYGSAGGLCGVNCRHSFSPFFEGMDNPFENYDSEENLAQYEKEQRQRTLERRIRNTKREVMGLKEAVEDCKDAELKLVLDLEYQKKALLLSNQNEAYYQFCASNELRPLQERLQIARFDRKQAAAARGAAKRYENAKTKKIESLRSIEKQPSVKMIKINTVDEAREALLSRIGFDHVDSISGINDELFIENTMQLVRLEDKFGAIHKSSFTRFDDVNHANAAACAESGYATPHIQSLSLCKSHYSDKAKMLQKEKKWVDSKWSVPCLESELPIISLTHEYGHMIQNNLVAQAMREAGWDEDDYFAFMDRKAKSANAKFKWYIKQRKAVQDMCYNEIIAIAKEKNPLFVLEDNISGYGKTNKAEFFAEVFANSQLGKPNELGNAMNEWLKRKGLIIE